MKWVILENATLGKVPEAGREGHEGGGVQVQEDPRQVGRQKHTQIVQKMLVIN